MLRQTLDIFLTLLPLPSFQMMQWQASCLNCSTRSRSAGTETTPSRSSATPSPPTPWTALGVGGSPMRSPQIDQMAPWHESARYSPHESIRALRRKYLMFRLWQKCLKMLLMKTPLAAFSKSFFFLNFNEKINPATIARFYWLAYSRKYSNSELQYFRQQLEVVPKWFDRKK